MKEDKGDLLKCVIEDEEERPTKCLNPPLQEHERVKPS